MMIGMMMGILDTMMMDNPGMMSMEMMKNNREHLDSTLGPLDSRPALGGLKLVWIDRYMMPGRLDMN